MPLRGPRRVLCVVEVTMSAYSQGLGCRPAATRPEKCAMSTRNSAPTLSAIWRKRGKSRMRGYALPPAMIIFGLCSSASFASSS